MEQDNVRKKHVYSMRDWVTMLYSRKLTVLGTRLGSSVSESETREHGRSRPALPLQKGAGAHPARGSRDPPCLSLTRGCTCALPGGQGRAHILLGGLIETACSWEKRERGGGGRRAFQPKPERNESPRFPLIDETLGYFPQQNTVNQV